MSNISKKLRPKIGTLRRRIYQKTKKDIYNVPTSGSWVIFCELYRGDKRYRDMIENMIYDKYTFPPSIFDHKAIDQLWIEFINGETKLLFDVHAIITFGTLNRLIPTSGIIF